MADSYSELCLLGPDYEFLLHLAHTSGLELAELQPGQAFSSKVLQHKGLVQFRQGKLEATDLGMAASRATATISQSGTAFITARSLAAAAV